MSGSYSAILAGFFAAFLLGFGFGFVMRLLQFFLKQVADIVE